MSKEIPDPFTTIPLSYRHIARLIYMAWAMTQPYSRTRRHSAQNVGYVGVTKMTTRSRPWPTYLGGMEPGCV